MNPNPLSPETIQVLGQIGGALLVVIGLLFVFLFTTLGLLVRRMDRMGDRIARTITDLSASHAEEIRQTFAMIQVVLDQHRPPTPPTPPTPTPPGPGPIQGGAPRMLVYRLVLPPVPVGVARRSLDVAVVPEDADEDAAYWINPGGVPGMEEGFACGEDCAIVPCDATEIGVPEGAIVGLTLVPYDALDQLAGDVAAFTFTARQPTPPPDPDGLGVTFLREED